jgi:hypothetical protein
MANRVPPRAAAVLVARWRLLSPGGEKLLNSGRSRLVRQGPPPEAGIAGTVTTLSELLADFSRQLAQSLRQVTQPRQARSAASSKSPAPGIESIINNSLPFRIIGMVKEKCYRLPLERRPMAANGCNDRIEEMLDA